MNRVALARAGAPTFSAIRAVGNVTPGGVRQRTLPTSSFVLGSGSSSGSSMAHWNPTMQHARLYASMPTQEQINSTFAMPMRQFINTLSRMARIIVFTTTGIALAGFIAFEGTHMYVEHFAMGKQQVGLGVFDENDEDSDEAKELKAIRQAEDVWGWIHDFGEETWVGLNRKGTDPRLGFLGRHQLRAAWMSLNWGVGVEPGQYMKKGGLGAPELGWNSDRISMVAQEGTFATEQFLRSTLATAEANGIRLPDMAAVRAGLQTYAGFSPTDRRPDHQAIDRTAVLLEYRLAGVRERRGAKEALKGALAAYTRLYDALCGVETTNRTMKLEGKMSGQPLIGTDRLVRLATRVGELHGMLGSKTEAEQWLLRAVSVAGGDAAGASSVEESKEGHAMKAVSDKIELEKPASTTGLSVDPAPSPSLTRSLIQSLLALSAFYAQPSDRSALERALQFQANALRLTRAETSRLGTIASDAAAKDEKNALGAQLYRLWLAHHDGLACVHVGETMYGLRLSKGGGNGVAGKSSIASLLSAVGLGTGADQKKQEQQDQTIAWLDEARSRSDLVLGQLTNAKMLRLGEKGELLSKWKEAPLAVQTYAGRLMRDATRLRDTVDEMKRILASQAQKQEKKR